MNPAHPRHNLRPRFGVMVQRENAAIARQRSGFDSPPLHQSGRSPWVINCTLTLPWTSFARLMPLLVRCGFESRRRHACVCSVCPRMHLVKQPDCRSGEGSSILLGGAAGRKVWVTGGKNRSLRAESRVRIPHAGSRPLPRPLSRPHSRGDGSMEERCSCTADIGVRLPVTPRVGPEFVGYQPLTEPIPRALLA